MDSYTAGMTLEEQIGQLLMVGFWGTTVPQEVIDLVQNCHVGGIILFSRNVRDAQQVLKLTQDLQRVAKEAGQRYPFLIAIDQENGMVRRLGTDTSVFPGNMALGAVGSEQVVSDVAQATGRELKALGINMNLAPVVDINNNPANPVIGVRSFGEDPHEVARLAAAAVRGYRSAGVLSCLKHFPGHGDTAVDSHLALPTIEYTMERLDEVELVPFKSGIEAGADSMMLAHIYLPSIMGHDVLPASVSPVVVQGLLREKLGFDEMIITDCLEMQAITETVGVERGAILALQAGVDLVLISHLSSRQRACIDAIQAAVRDGELSPEVMRRAAERVLSLKARFLSWADLPVSSVPEWVGGISHRQLGERAYELSTTLVRNEDGLLPLRLDAEGRIVVVSPRIDALTQVEDRDYPEKFLAESIKQRYGNVSAKFVSLCTVGDECEEILRMVGDSDVLIVMTVNAHLDSRQAELMQCLVQSRRCVVGIAVCNPYDLLVFPQLRTYLITYEYTQPALAAAVRVLFGEIQARGRLPVGLPGLYQRI